MGWSCCTGEGWRTATGKGNGFPLMVGSATGIRYYWQARIPAGLRFAAILPRRGPVDTFDFLIDTTST
uniref:Lipoprotein LpqB, beta-propeller domain-like protein n=1 Tax=Rubinisphaera brasiliensis (strain ATCC 49424 / DSM 5305 / JCM 21570 / IAM 15109 / NBRC 103401 / IFAM 1448) TaxID=756272 RepID=F0SNT8_RUBBR|nr:lipoprotein LpqB, beta-propeller domain-like protein [Rubinisphaera brasiliensis DSM 5305]